MLCFKFAFIYGSLFFSRYRQTRFSSRRVRKRVVFKHGDCNVVQGNVAKRRRRYLQVNFFCNTLVLKLIMNGKKVLRNLNFHRLIRIASVIYSFAGHLHYAGGCAVAMDAFSVLHEFFIILAWIRAHMVADRVQPR